MAEYQTPKSWSVMTSSVWASMWKYPASASQSLRREARPASNHCLYLATAPAMSTPLVRARPRNSSVSPIRTVALRAASQRSPT